MNGFRVFSVKVDKSEWVLGKSENRHEKAQKKRRDRTRMIRMQRIRRIRKENVEFRREKK
jgi:hypothetical protein